MSLWNRFSPPVPPPPGGAPPPPPPPGGAPPPPPPPGGTPPPPPPPGGAPPPPPPPGDPQAEAYRAAFELDSAYRDLRRGDVMLQQMQPCIARQPDLAAAQEVFALASRLYQMAFSARQQGQPYRAAEYAVAVKDMMRALDKFYHVCFAEETYR